MSKVVLENLSKSYGGIVTALDELNIEVEDGEFLVLVGPSGCGKSTALRMIAGLEEITSGAVWIGGEIMNDVHSKDRDIAMVFQNYALYPHMRVFDNIAFALQIAKVPKAEIEKRVRDVASVLQLEDMLDRRPGQLSGGQRQRVAMGRAIVREPSVFLMDEPLSNLDAKLRVQMRAEISGLQDRLGVTTIYVTHDQIEAMTMGDRVALLKDGVLQQVDAPSEIYNNPHNMFVATFIGSPTMNLYWADLDGGADGNATLRLGNNLLEIPASVLSRRPALSRFKGKPLVVGIRPEDIEDATTLPALGGARVEATVALVEALGSDVMVHLGLDARAAEVQSSDSLQDIQASDSSARCIARFSAKSTVQLNQRVVATFDTERLYFFDGDSGEAIVR